MKVLYAIQGTGNGHLSRAREIVPLLKNRCDLDILVSGYQADIALPFDVKFRLRGLSFMFGKKGGIDLWNTYVEANTEQFLEEINSVPVEEYDFVLNDFEPVSAWACYRKNVPCISFSHQSAVLDKQTPKPKKRDALGKFILKNYAPSSLQYGLHFCRYSKNIYTPVIRSEVRNSIISDQGHYTVYLPSYSDETLVETLKKINHTTQWQIFSKFAKEIINNDRITIFPITSEHFIKSMASSTGVLCGAGFETPAEAIFLGKKLMVIPMTNQYEQQCNAAALKDLGIPVIKKLKDNAWLKIKDWIDSDYFVSINYPDQTEQIISTIFQSAGEDALQQLKWRKTYSLKFWWEKAENLMLENHVIKI